MCLVGGIFLGAGEWANVGEDSTPIPPSRENPEQGGGGGWEYGISRGIKEIACVIFSD